MELWELIARECIRDTIAAYNQSGDSGRFDEMVATFAPDGVIEIVGTRAGRHEGHDALHAFFSGVKAEPNASASSTRRPTVLRHCVTNTRIHVLSPTEATARSYFSVITDIGLDHWGTYRDRLAPTPDGDRWRFTQRTVKTDGHTPGSFFVAT
jgi:hypothetical protein